MRLRLLITLLIFTLVISNITASGEIEDKLDRKIQMTKNPLKKMRVMVFLKEGSSIELPEEKIIHKFETSPIVVTNLNKLEMNRIKKDPNVEKILIDRKVSVARASSLPVIKHANLVSSQYNGTGINISIVDTGVFNHSEFISPNRISPIQKCYCYGNEDIGESDCCLNGLDQDDNATDDNGHGTHCAGIAAGEFGVANGSTVMAVKVLDSSGTGYSSDIAKGIEWAFLNGSNVISLSMGGCIDPEGPDASCYDECYDSPASRMVDNAVKNGTVVVVAIGNCGPNPSPGCVESGNESISWPACAKGAISIGNTDDNDLISSSSSRGPTDIDNRTKPDLTAPGVLINSTSNSLNGYESSSGTSQSTPFVSGAAALILQKYNETFGYLPPPARIKAILMASTNSTGMESAGYLQRNNVYGSGRLDIEEGLRIINFTRNDTISTNESKKYKLNVSGNSKIALYWEEDRNTNYDLDLIVGNLTDNFTYPTSSNDTVEHVILSSPSPGFWDVFVIGTSSSSQEFELASNMGIFNDITPPALSMDFPENKTYRYNVSIPINFTTDSTNQTIWYTLNSGQEVKITGNGTFNITSESVYLFTLSVNDSYNNINQSSIYLTYTEDPLLENASVDKPAVFINESVNISANIQDEMLNYAWTNVTFPNGSSVEEPMLNYSSLYYLEFNQTNQTGRYNITVFANDTDGNQVNSSLYFNVGPSRIFSLNITSEDNMTFTIFYDGTSIERNKTTNSTFNYTFPGTLWDIRLNKSDFILDFFDMNVSQNTDSNLSISEISSNISVSETNIIKGFGIDLEGISFDRSNMTFHFNDSLVSNASKLIVYKCSDWNVTCQGSWVNYNSNSTINTNNASLVTWNYSAFALVENVTEEETVTTTTTTTSSTTTVAGTVSSGGSSGGDGTTTTTSTSTTTVEETTTIITTTVGNVAAPGSENCGDGVCQESENCENCAEDCNCEDKKASAFDNESSKWVFLVITFVLIFVIMFVFMKFGGTAKVLGT